MKLYYLKIRDKFINEVVGGLKRREYRLANEERRKIKVGDTLVLVSNQNRKNFVKVTVKKVKCYPNWGEALKDNWQSDFKNLYSSLEDAIKECQRFYSKDDVDKYGIIVFEMEPLRTSYKNTSVLLDTNIIVKRESSNNVSFEVANLFNWFDKENVKKYIHPLTKDELSSHKDESIRQTMLTKASAYSELPNISSETDSYFESIISKYPKDKNGLIDNALLKEVYNDNVEILVTDDNLILLKAEELYIRDKVLTSAELLKIFENLYPRQIEYKMLKVKLNEFSEVDLNDRFFDTLREDYGGVDFDKWFKGKAKKKEKAYVFDWDKGLQGFLYLKIEDADEKDYTAINPPLSPKRRLKVGTFKILNSGFRLGERFLKIIFDNARKSEVEEIYVTLFEDKREDVMRLKALMEQWGFVKWGYKQNGEAVLVKSLKIYRSDKDIKFNYPLTPGNRNYYFLPIYPQYHTDLFPDMILKNEDMHLYDENKAHRYAIEKIYITGAFNIKAKPGDLILIYRTGERYPKKYTSVVSGIAIMEQVIETKNIEECIALCKDRSIFSESDISIIYKKYHTVVKLLDYIPFKNKVTLDSLNEHGIIAQDTGPRPFEKLSEEHFKAIYRLGMEE